MTVLALRPHPAADRLLPVADGRIARVDIIEDIAAAEPYWRALEQGKCLATAYQRYDFLKLWQRHIGTPAGITPFIAVGFNAKGLHNVDDQIKMARRTGVDCIWCPAYGFTALFTVQTPGLHPDQPPQNYADLWGTKYGTNEHAWPAGWPEEYAVESREDWAKIKEPDVSGPETAAQARVVASGRVAAPEKPALQAAS